MLLISTAALSVAVSVDENSCNMGSWSEKQKLLAGDGAGNDRFVILVVKQMQVLHMFLYMVGRLGHNNKN